MHQDHIIYFMNRVAVIFLVFSVAACSTQSQKGVVDAATSPLSDLNLIKKGIPVVLVEARKSPYAIPADQACAALGASIKVLDDALEPGRSSSAADKKPDLIQRGTAAIGSSAVGALRSTTEGIVPFRGWIRKLSGAERHSKEVADAIAAGLIRRAFLEGFRTAKECSLKTGQPKEEKTAD